jgi:hypothetical protein
VKSVFSQGAGVVVKKEGKEMAGAVVSYNGRTMRIPHFGAPENGVDAFRDGSAFALDYFVAELAHSSGYDYVDFGHSRPFLSDGILRYKLNWHMEVRDDDDSVGVFAIATPGRTAAAEKFLAANRFFHLTPDGLRLYDEHPEEDDSSD